MVVGGNEVNVYAGDAQDGLPLEARRVEAGLVTSIVGGEDVEGRTRTEGVRSAVWQGLRVVDEEGKELEEGADASWDGEPAARVVGHDAAAGHGSGACPIWAEASDGCRRLGRRSSEALVVWTEGGTDT